MKVKRANISNRYIINQQFFSTAGKIVGPYTARPNQLCQDDGRSEDEVRCVQVGDVKTRQRDSVLPLVKSYHYTIFVFANDTRIKIGPAVASEIDSIFTVCNIKDGISEIVNTKSFCEVTRQKVRNESCASNDTG